MTAELIVDAKCELGEGILWDASRACVWWTDIDGRAIWRFDPRSKSTERYAPPDRVGFMAVTADGGLLLGAAKALFMGSVDDGALHARKLTDVEADLPTTRVNDGRADRFGNVVFGTLDEQKPRRTIGSYYQYSTARGLRRLDLPQCAVSNSLCFSPDGRTLYFTDTPTSVIRRCDYDPDAAAVSNIRDLVAIPAGGGHPDGSIVDADGCVWNAAWGGRCVRRFTPDGALDRTVILPAKNPTCPAFGGDDLGSVFISSSRQDHTPDELAASPHAGGVFGFRISGIHGIADTPFV